MALRQPKVPTDILGTPEEVRQVDVALEPEKLRLAERQDARMALGEELRQSQGLQTEAESKQKIGVKQAGVRATEDYVTDIEREQRQYRELLSANPLPTHKPTQEDLSTYAQLGSLLMTMGLMIGAGGKGNAKAGLDAMTGMLNGWKKGRQDLWAQEAKNFEKAFNKVKADRDTIYKNLQEGMKLASTNYAAAKEKFETAAFIAGEGSIVAHRIRTGQLQQALKDMENVDKVWDEFNNKRRAAIGSLAQARLQRELAQMQADAMVRAAREKSQQAGIRRDEKAMQAIGPALRNIAENYPDGTANTLVGASPEDKKRIQGSYRALEESEATADFVARNPDAVGALAVVKNIVRMDAIKSIGQSDNEQQAAQAKAAYVDAEIDKAQQQGKISADAAQQAKVLQKKLFGLALSDVQGSGQRGSVYLDRQFQNLYDQASRQDTLLKIIRERAEENNRNLRIYKMNIERHNNPENFPLAEAYDDEKLTKYIKDRKPKSTVPPEVESKLNGKPNGTGYKDPATNKIYRIYDGVVRQAER